jgi:hypothetical protein
MPIDKPKEKDSAIIEYNGMSLAQRIFCIFGVTRELFKRDC